MLYSVGGLAPPSVFAIIGLIISFYDRPVLCKNSLLSADKELIRQVE